MTSRSDPPGALHSRSDGEVPWAHTLFEQPWWLEAVAPGSWDEVVIDKAGQVAARLPFVVRKRYGVTALTQAPLTRFLGPWLRPATGKYTNRIAAEIELMSEIVERLPAHDVFQISFDPDVTNWLPFHWADFGATVRYTYRIDDTNDLDAVWANFASATRGHIRRAERDLRACTDLDLQSVLDLNRGTFARQGLAVPFDDDFARRLDRACVAHDARTIIGAVDAGGRVHAACYVVHDSRTSYLLYGGDDPSSRSSHGTSLIVWEAIRQAAANGRRLDFLGSMSKPLEQRNRGFGARQVPYLFVSRERPMVHLARVARDGAQRARRRLPELASGLRGRLRSASPGAGVPSEPRLDRRGDG
jgi:hypothetical protein